MHAGRGAYFVVGEKIIMEPDFLSPAGAGCPMAAAAAAEAVVEAAAEAAVEASAEAAAPRCPHVKFGRMFPPRWGEDKSKDELLEIAHGLTMLGACMNDPKTCHNAAAAAQEESSMPAGYTYLGQFIAHEITFDDTNDLQPVLPDPDNIRSPSLDLDSLYGAGPGCEKWKKLYDDANPARLKVGTTEVKPKDKDMDDGFRARFANDLPREEKKDKDGKVKMEAVIGDERNDENLPLAQTHVAFIKFHNRVVGDLEQGRYRGAASPPEGELFDRAREEVVKHFQWIVLRDYLPRLVDRDLLDSVIRKPVLFKPGSEEGLFIPLEFSVAAFRLGHSMVRQRYEWNRRQADVSLLQLFPHTSLSGDLDGLKALDSTWVIDWKHFYDFRPLAGDYPAPYNRPQKPNMAGRIDTVFDLPLQKIKGFDHKGLLAEKQFITVRNLLRGLALGLPWGEEVADLMDKEGLLAQDERLTPDELRRGIHAERLDYPAFEGKTPLWFYVLKEAREKREGRSLGRVGGRIVAETLVGLIRHSRHSILGKVGAAEDPEWEFSDWRPAYPRKLTEPETFEMVDLLRAAETVEAAVAHVIDRVVDPVVDPLGWRVYKDNKSLY